MMAPLILWTHPGVFVPGCVYILFGIACHRDDQEVCRIDGHGREINSDGNKVATVM